MRSGLRKYKLPERNAIHPIRNGGFSLVELLLALALGLVVITGIVQLFVGNSKTYNILHGQSRLQENARFAFDFLSRSARKAGYRGCAPEPVNVVKGLRGAWAVIPEFNVLTAIDGYEGNGNGTWSPALSSLPRTTGGTSANVYVAGNGVDTTTIQPGSDVLVFRSVDSTGSRLTQVLQPDGNPRVEAPGGTAPFATNEIVLVSNCEQAALFKITGVAVSGSTATLSHSTASTGNFYENSPQVESPTGLVPYTLSILGREYGREARVSRFETTIFFIAPSTIANNRNQVVLALWQKVGSNAPMELIPGVDDMEVMYGVDTTLADGISNANQYLSRNAVTNLDQVVSIRVSLDVNSVDVVTDTGAQLQRTFSKTIRVRNSNPEV